MTKDIGNDLVGIEIHRDLLDHHHDIAGNAGTSSILSVPCDGRQVRRINWEDVKVTQAGDIRFVTSHLRLWGSREGRDRGEAEVLVLSKRYGWIAVMDDCQGRAACTQHGVHCCFSVTFLAAAAAMGIDGKGRREAWELHKLCEVGRPSPVIPTTDDYQRVFTDSCKKFRKLWQRLDEPERPEFLAHGPILDRMIEELVARKQRASTQ